MSNSSEIVTNLNTTLSENSNFYLLRHSKIEPEISVNFENYSGNTIYGEGVVGTTVDVVDSDHVEGITGKGLHLHDGAYVRLTGSGTECWTNLDHCSSGMSVSIWFKATIPDLQLHSSEWNPVSEGLQFNYKSCSHSILD